MSDKIILNFEISGVYRKNNRDHTFTRQKRGIRKEDCVEQIYMEFGSNHGVKRKDIRIDEVKVIPDEELSDPILKELAEGKNVRIVLKD
ncbi:MAG: 50S ribosomal protein L18Ae [Candidatus Hodarchaeales archaeon]